MTIQLLPRPIPHQHLSAKLDQSEPYKFAIIDAKRETATQCSMDQAEQTTIMYLLQLSRIVRDWPGGQKLIDRWIDVGSGLSHVFRDLNPQYRMKALKDGRGGTWATDQDGRAYGIPRYFLGALKKFALGKGMAPQVATLAPEWLDFLDVKLAGGKVVAGADFTFPPPVAYDKKIAALGTITSAHPMVPLNTDLKAKLDAATKAHQHGSDPHAHPDEEQSHLAVQELLRQLEWAARTEEERHFVSLLQFNGGHDPLWSAEDGVLLGKLEDVYWNLWRDEVEKPTPNWATAHYHEIAHQNAHVMYAYKTMHLAPSPHDEGGQIVVRFPQIDGGKFRSMNDCPSETQAEVMERLRTGTLIGGTTPVEVPQ